MKIKSILGGFATTATLISACSSGTDKGILPKPEHPNVLIILTDDQGWGDIKSHGNDTLETPNLDKLASQSYRFNRFYVSPVCAPTRASLLTGRYHLRTGVHGVTGRREIMRNSEFSIAEVFSEHEYNTSYFGKWHNGAQYPHNPQGQGFKHFFGFCAGHWNNYFSSQLEFNNRYLPTEGYITDVLTDSLIAYLKTPRRNPFLSILAYNTPHTPYQVPDEYYNKFRNTGMDEAKAAIYGMVENLDYNIGRVLTELSKSGLDKNTVIVFLTDNGPNGWRFNGNMKGIKGWVDEGGVRVPCFMKVPWMDTTENQINAITAHIDLFPTLASVCNVTLPQGLWIDGLDLSPLLRNPSKKFPERFIYTDRGLGSKKPFAVRSEKYLLSVSEDTLLFDLETDPGQKSDISRKNPEMLNTMMAKYNKWYREVTAFGFKIPPVEIGHPNIPGVEMPAHEANLSEGVKFYEGHGWAHDWVTGFRDAGDSISWDVKVVREATFDVGILLESPGKNIDHELAVHYKNQSSILVFDQAYSTIRKEMHDRVERKEAPDLEWQIAWLKGIRLPAGEYPIVLTTGFNALPAGIEIKGVWIEESTDNKL